MKMYYQNINRNTIGVFIIFIGVCMAVLIRLDNLKQHELDIKNKNREFAGKVKQIEYDIKQFPAITIGDSTYYIGSGYDTDHQIEIGDSAIKRKGSDVYILIKSKTHQIIKFSK